ncbi:ImmA/IrrE family metallo-endopeptidase [Veillonella montpellierensis]|uniref:ImmA/IrrE family metallo-endopeptidase n=1 Tax=Veillonella montpellierensis TaxID=187328 RepID=UPI0023F644ED|nr:ImmA/IrrE family metallo-endopeptidase [Veillonella montpellierensis]
MAGIKVSPRSLRDIRRIARNVREILGYETDGRIDIVRLLEHRLGRIGLEYEIKLASEMGSKHGETYLDQDKILIREDVYNNACKGSGRDRLTIAHEIGHFILHRASDISLARDTDEEVKPFEDPEWQANAFAGELLAPYEFVKGKNVFDVSKIYGVSEKAASIQCNRKR